MFDSIKCWMNVPFSHKRYIKRNGAGTKMYDEEQELMCYPVSDIIVITNDDGAEYTSGTQLYVDGSVSIKTSDEVTFEGQTRSVQHVATYYRNGVPDIRVVYL